VSFIRLLEPRAVGRFADQQVSLSKDQIEILEDFYLKSITDKTFNEYPIIDYPGYHQRRTGCLGAGNRYLYVDSVGDYHACPFCQRVAGNAFNMSFDDIRINLQKSKCQAFHASNL
jgi:MoaA/NifB/PqqE/SkfB family radical SAM enzyme